MSEQQQQRHAAPNPFANFIDYIEPDYKFGPGYRSPQEIRTQFNEFSNGLINKDFEEALRTGDQAKNPYNFNSHFGQYIRYLDAAKDEYVKAVLAFYAERAKNSKTE